MLVGLVTIYVRQLVSMTVLCGFLSVLLVLALAKHFVMVYWVNIKTHLDVRDTRPTRTRIDRSVRNDEHITYDHIYSKNQALPRQGTPDSLENPVCSEKDSDRSRYNPYDGILLEEDLKLVPSLKYYYQQYGIDVDEIEIETPDGFILDMWHLKARAPVERKSENCLPILMVHGLLQSSASFASSGRRSLAYFFVEQGFDVWLGNNRSGFRKKINRRRVPYEKKWDWDIHEMCKYDLRTLVETVLFATGQPKLTLMAHSQGTTQTFMSMLHHSDENFDFKDKIANFVALAPALYPGPLLDEKLFVKFLIKGIDKSWIFGTRSFLEMMMIVRNFTVGKKIFSFVCYVMFNYLFEWNDLLWDKPLRDRHFLFSPVYVSVKLMQWWLSPLPGKFSFKNCAEMYFPETERWFPSSESRPNFLLFVPKQDRLVNGERLINHFMEHEDHDAFKIWYIDEYSHMDILWAHDVIERIGMKILENIQ